MPWVVPPVSYSPSRAVMDILDKAACKVPPVTLQRNINLFRGLLKDASKGAPDQAIYVLGSGAEPPQTNSGTPETILVRATVNVYVRTATNTFAEGEDLARFVWRQLHHNVPKAPYYEIECTEGEPGFIDLDNTEHPRWLIQVRLSREE